IRGAGGIRISINAVFTAISVGGGIVNSSGGLISGKNSAIAISSATFTGTISNAGTISDAGNAGIVINNRAVFTAGGGIVNSSGGLISAKSSAIRIINATFSGSISNAGTISGALRGIRITSNAIFTAGSAAGGIINSSGGLISGKNSAIVISNATFSGGITNAGTISASGGSSAHAISIANGTFLGGITNTGTINASATTSAARALLISQGTFAGGISNGGQLSAYSSSSNAITILINGGTFVGGVSNSGTISASTDVQGATGIEINGISFSGGLTNTGTIVGTNAGTTNLAKGIVIQNAFTGTLSNAGLIVAAGGGTKNRFAIDALNSTNAVTIDQSAGQILGGIRFSQHGDTLAITGGVVRGSLVKPNLGAAVKNAAPLPTTVTISGGVLGFEPTDSASGIDAITQTGGQILVQVTGQGTPTSPSVNAASLTLTAVEAAPQSGSFAAGSTTTYGNIFTGTTTLNNSVTTVPVFDFFSTAVTGQLVANGSNALNLVLTNTGAIALTPGVDNGFAFAGTFTNPLGAVLPLVSVTNGASVGGAIVNQGTVGPSVATAVAISGSTIGGGISNSGLIASSGGAADLGIAITGGSFSGGITNTAAGVIAGGVADPILGLLKATGTAIKSTVAVGGGISNAGTIAGATAIDLTGVASGAGATAITQSGGLIVGAIKLSTNADTLTITGASSIQGDITGQGSATVLTVAAGSGNSFAYGGATGNTISGVSTINVTSGDFTLGTLSVLNVPGAITVSPGARVVGTGTFSLLSTGTFILPVTASTAAGAFGTVSAAIVTLANGGTIQVKPSGSFTPGQTLVFADVFTASQTLTKGSLTTPNPTGFTVAVVTDALNPKALDVDLTAAAATPTPTPTPTP
ncbi:MAG: beta strand repeat-containing protein, partial [Terriglobales bacterium]